MGSVSQTTRLLEWVSFFGHEKTRNEGKEGVKCYIKSFDFDQKKPISFEATRGFVHDVIYKIARAVRSLLGIKVFDLQSQLQNFVNNMGAKPIDADIQQYLVKNSDQRVGQIYQNLANFFGYVEERAEKIEDVTVRKKLTEQLQAIHNRWNNALTSASANAFLKASGEITDLSVTENGRLNIRTSSGERSADEILNTLGLEGDRRSLVLTEICQRYKTQLEQAFARELQKWTLEPPSLADYSSEMWSRIDRAFEGRPLPFIQMVFNQSLDNRIRHSLKAQMQGKEIERYEIRLDSKEGRVAIFIKLTNTSELVSITQYANELAQPLSGERAFGNRVRALAYDEVKQKFQKYQKEAGGPASAEGIQARIKEFYDEEFRKIADIPATKQGWIDWLLGVKQLKTAEEQIKCCKKALQDLDASWSRTAGQIGAFFLAEGADLLGQDRSQAIVENIREQFNARYEGLLSLKGEYGLIAHFDRQIERMEGAEKEIAKKISQLKDTKIPESEAAPLILLLDEYFKACDQMVKSLKDKGDETTKPICDAIRERAKALKAKCAQRIRDLDKKTTGGQGPVYIHVEGGIHIKQEGTGNICNAACAIYGDVINKPYIVQAAHTAEVARGSFLSRALGQAVTVGAMGAFQGFIAGGVPGALTMGVAAAGSAFVRPFIAAAAQETLPAPVAQAVSGMAMMAMTHYTQQYLQFYMQGWGKEEPKPVEVKPEAVVEEKPVTPQVEERVVFGPEPRPTLDMTGMGHVVTPLVPGRGTVLEPPVRPFSQVETSVEAPVVEQAVVVPPQPEQPSACWLCSERVADIWKEYIGGMPQTGRDFVSFAAVQQITNPVSFLSNLFGTIGPQQGLGGVVPPAPEKEQLYDYVRSMIQQKQLR